MKRVFTAAIVAISIYGMFGCSITGGMRRHQTTAGLTQLTPRERSQSQEQSQESPTPPTPSSPATSDSAVVHLMDSEVVDGERVGALAIEEVTIVAKMRSLPERNGKVTIDFMIKIPKELLGRGSSVVITPCLHRLGGEESLQELTIRGITFDRLQRRDYWQYEKYINRHPYDSVRVAEIFNRFVKFPRHQDPRLDSLSEHRSHITYYYSQDVPTDKIEKRMLITIKGQVVGLDKSRYTTPPSDTLTYLVSSMLSFLDRSPRYRIKIIDKYKTIEDRHHIRFRVNETRLIDSLSNNGQELDDISVLLTQVIEQQEFHVDTITLTATASPEGGYAHNNQLAERRAESLRDYLVERCGNCVGEMLTVRWIAEDWTRLRELIIEDEEVPNGESIIKIIDSHEGLDSREMAIRRLHPKVYSYIKKHLYPQLRGVNFKYNLRRVWMVKDTIHTTELDTSYARGVELLEGREYAKALYILHRYDDRNTVIAHLSMGHDGQALEMLQGLPTTAINEYLRAIAHSRLGQKEQGRRLFESACRLDAKMRFRANLDPEIRELLKP